MIDSPLGPLITGANEKGIVLLEYTDRRMLENNLNRLRRRFDCGVVPGRHSLLDQLEQELKAYFEGDRREFTLPLAARGTPFQEKVWAELQRIPYNQTISYDELATR